MSTVRARRPRKDPTEAEKRLWSRLRRTQIDGHSFRRREPIGRYVVDFVCFAKRLVVEVEGGQHGPGAERDARRIGWLLGQGFRVLRFWNNEVLGNTDGVVEVIGRALSDSRA